MASSYRSDLNRGYFSELEKPLEIAVAKIEEALDLFSSYTSDQTDNAEEDGALREKLRIARDLIEEELPSIRKFKV